MTRLEEQRREEAAERRRTLRYVLGTVVATGLYFWALCQAGALFLSLYPL